MNKPFSVLKRLRELVFVEFTEKLPEFQGCELYARKKLNLIAGDIYIFAFSKVSGLPDLRVKTSLKPVVNLDDTHISVNDEEKDTDRCVELFVKMRDELQTLKTEIKALKNRVNFLESNQTKDHLNTDNRTNDDSTVGERLGTTNQGNKETEGQTEPEQNSSEATGEYSTNDDGNIDNSKKDSEQKKLTYRDVAMNGKPGGSDCNNSGFRHTCKQRRDIQRGLQVSQNFLANQKKTFVGPLKVITVSHQLKNKVQPWYMLEG